MKQGATLSLPKGWEIERLGGIAKVIYGYTDRASFRENGPKFLRITDIQEGGVNWETVPYCKISDSDFEKYKLSNGDIVFARTGATTGKSFLVTCPPKAVFASYLIKVQISFRELMPEYLFHYFQTKTYWDLINAGVAGAAQGGFNATKLSNLQTPIPPLPEQRRIVAILDQTFAAIAKAKANAEQNLKNAKELFESYLQGVFEARGKGWEEKTLGDVCEISSKLIDPKKSEFQDFVHIGAGNIEAQKGTLVNLKTAREENLISGKFLFDESMVLYSKIRPYLMKVVNCSFKGLCSADIYPLHPIRGVILKEYLFRLLLTKDFTDYAILGSQRAGMPKVNREYLFAYRFTLPSFSKQQSIVRQLDALSAETKKLEAIYQKKIHNLEELKKSVLQKAFSGELKTEKALIV
ncbi:MAG: restriction endonuclease subunit S [Bacteroidetes bacterium]|nr:restriction endonuclease subunit S [Bacteroidota bacterium]